LYPVTLLDELAVQLIVTLAGVELVPAPVRLTVGDEEALLEKVTLPVELVTVVGANVIVRVVLCPAVRLAGVVMPLPEKPVPVTLTCERLRVALPEFVIVSDCVPVVPSGTFPKATVVELTEIAGAAGAVPVPVIETAEGDVGALLEMETLPGALPVVAGANLTLKLAVPPAATLAGKAIPLTE
jgi:hypothetical protein